MQQGLALVLEPRHFSGAILEVPFGGNFENGEKTLQGVAGGTHRGRTIAVIVLQCQRGRQEAQAILEALLQRSAGS